MGSYRRRGHYRRGRNGTRHWVSAHYVRRGRQKSTRKASISFSRRTLSSNAPSAPRRPISHSLLAPNSRCPVCGALTYFYANEHGSKVYFDELGPPWPKHPCLGAQNAIGGQRPSDAAVRSSPLPGTTQVRITSTYRTAMGPSSALQTSNVPGGTFYPRPPEGPWTVLGRWAVDGGTILHMHPLHQRRSVWAWQTLYAVLLNPGDTVFLRDGWISYFDLGRFEVVASPVNLLAMLSRPEGPPLLRLFRRLMGRG